MKKVFLIASVFLVVAFLVYYLFIRSYEFQVTFKAETTPGDITETLRIWTRGVLKDSEIAKVDSFSNVSQTIVWNKQQYKFNWQFSSEGDSATMVEVQISQPGRELANKILVPFSHQQIETDAADVVREFYQVLKSHLQITKVKVSGESDLDSAFCVCRRLQTNQVDKANGMMRDYMMLSTFIADNNLQPSGVPIVKINEWSHSGGRIKFDFCFPIVRHENLPKSDKVFYKTVSGEKVLKAEYNGNYITSDRAWYALIEYANRNGYTISGLPIEYFYNNPNLGANESEWKAEVFLPVSSKK